MTFGKVIFDRELTFGEGNLKCKMLVRIICN